MKNMAILAITAGLAIPGMAQDAGKTQVTAVHLTITGTITNFDEFAALVVPESYVQLVPLTADGNLGISTDAQGRFAYNSDLPKLPVPKKAEFSFDVPNARPGKYFLAAQRLRAQGMTAQGSFPGHRPDFITATKKQFTIEIPADAKSPLTINAGAMTVWIH